MICIKVSLTSVHCGSKVEILVGAEVPSTSNTSQEIVTQTIGNFGQSVGIKWSDQKGVSPFPQL
jgi:hypothetical protein